MTRPARALLPLVLVVCSLAVGWYRTAGAAPSASPEAEQVDRGAELYRQGCASCHGAGGSGTADGPTLIGVGAASADFMLTTGRMPLSRTGIQPPRKPPAYDRAEIDALVAYIASLGDGPPIPDVRPARGELATGGELFRLDCAACHHAAATGGPLSSGRHAPALDQATPTQIGEAIRIGPGQMPAFDASTISDADIDSIARYVVYLRDPADPGGLSLGRTGPVAEGFVTWIFGIGAFVLLIRWITREHRHRSTDG